MQEYYFLYLCDLFLYICFGQPGSRKVFLLFICQLSMKISIHPQILLPNLNFFFSQYWQSYQICCEFLLCLWKHTLKLCVLLQPGLLLIFGLLLSYNPGTSLHHHLGNCICLSPLLEPIFWILWFHFSWIILSFFFLSTG